MPSKRSAVNQMREEMRASLDEDCATTEDDLRVPTDLSIDEDLDRSSSTQSLFDSKGTNLLPLLIGNNVVKIDPEFLELGKRSLAVLVQVPRFKGIRNRLPEFYAIESTNNTKVSLVPHMRALTMFIHSLMATRIFSNNVNMDVSTCNAIIHHHLTKIFRT